MPSPISPAPEKPNTTSSQARRLGATKPPRLPMALISPMPPAAAAPASNPVGRVQNKAGDTIRPQAAALSAASANSGDPATADSANEQPASARMIAPTPRALPRRSHQGGIKLTPRSAQAQGMAVTRPTSN